MPPMYVMQGLIGDTGGDWQLYKQHHTISMITDFILHPVGHLAGGGHHAMHGDASHSEHGMDSATVGDDFRRHFRCDARQETRSVCHQRDSDARIYD